YIVASTQLHWIHLRRVMGAVLLHSGSREGIWDEHEAIRAAIRAGDAAAAGELSERHAQAARTALLGRLAQALPSPPRAA
ncbi:MAG: FCD domain-containing protein, partial [Burkholderiales bacterium]|nr:FCD domain-containing protein [Burkholderiales bacterium]